jgi:peptidoglycan/LPS O-acetylase OafA/YrhL
MKFEDRLLAPSANNFNFVRLVLASSVIYTHAYAAVFRVYEVDALHWLFGAPISAYAVDGFFFLSGFLVYPSLIRNQSSVKFLVARFVRIWPGLAACVLLMVLAGRFLTLTPQLYFSGETLQFVFGHLTFVKAYYNLPGVVCGDALCNVNGSLWTLPWEVRCYLVLAVLGVLGWAKPRYMALAVLPLTVVMAIVWDLPIVSSFVFEHFGPGAIYIGDIIDRLWPMFALGMAAYIFRARLVFSWWILAVLAVLTWGAHQIGLGLHVRGLFAAYLVMMLGFRTTGRGAFSAKWQDYSYGMYIYGGPVMLALTLKHVWNSHLLLALATAGVTLIFAAASWNLIEKPALAFAKRGRVRSAPVTTLTPLDTKSAAP